MKVQLLNDSSAGLNWGGKATTAGLKQTFRARWPKAEMSSVAKPPLPFRKLKCLRRFAEQELARVLKSPDTSPRQLERALKRLKFQLPDGSVPDRVFLNGEGAIRAKSGHVTRLLGILRLFQEHGAWVAAVNHSIELRGEPALIDLVRAVYARLDHVTVREPISLREIQAVGIEQAVLVPDAAFSHGPLTDSQIESHLKRMDLPNEFVCLTGSSALSAGNVSAAATLVDSVRSVTRLPIVMLNSTKTDIALGQAMKRRYPNFHTVAPPEPFQAAMAAIARAKFLAGGRFHPAIFAAVHGTPIVVLPGNTHKMAGLVELLEYPIPPVDWCDGTNLISRLRETAAQSRELSAQLRERSARLAVAVRNVAGPPDNHHRQAA